MRTKIAWEPARLTLLALVCTLIAGCGILNLKRTDFPFAAIGEDDQGLFLEDINEIVNDPDLTDDKKRDALRDDLGIEDEDLIDALLAG